MKKLLGLGLLLAFGLTGAKAGDVYLDVGPIGFVVPLKNAEVGYLRDVIHGEDLVGAETELVRFWEFANAGFGAITTLNDRGSPYVSGNVDLNYIMAKATGISVIQKNPIRVGWWGGRNFNSGRYFTGFKANVKTW